MATLTAMLLSMAELSNVFSVFVVIVCFCAMILFITRNMLVLRVNGEDVVFQPQAQPTPPPPRRIPQMQMMKVHIPFTFKLIDPSSSSYETGIDCCVSSQVPYELRTYWGVDIRELHAALWRPSFELLHDAEPLRPDAFQLKGKPERNESHAERAVSFVPSANLCLGTPPRLVYPLVVFLTRKNNYSEPYPDDAVALVTVVHVRDDVCTLQTSVLAQYLKQANGRLSCLKQLYLATGSPEEEMNDPPSPMSAHDEDLDIALFALHEPQLCVVCAALPLSRALLPCRHTCVCACCFAQLERCPLCRSPIKSYFCIRAEDYMPQQQTDEKKPRVPPLLAWIDSWNDRLTDFLGFAR